MDQASRLPSLHALYCFDVAARSRSFTAAGRELGLTHGAISRQMRILQDELATTLFVRTGKSMSLTPEAVSLHEVTQSAFGTLREGIAGMRRRRSGPLVVSCEPTLALHWLMPRLGRLGPRHPARSIHLELRGGPVHFATSEGHLAIRRADFAVDPDLDRQPLMEEWLGPVCSPETARALRAGVAPRLLHTRTRPAAFADWLRLSGRTLASSGERSFDHFAWSLEAAVAGLGVAMGPRPLVEEALLMKRLVAPFGFVRGDVGYVTLVPSNLASDPRVLALRRWLAAEAERASR